MLSDNLDNIHKTGEKKKDENMITYNNKYCAVLS